MVIAAGQEGASGIWWLEAQDAKYPTMHRTVSQTKNYLTQTAVEQRLRNPV